MGALKNIILDRLYLRSLEKLMVKEGFASHRYDGDQVDAEYISNARNTLKSKTLLLLTLFETIDSDFTPLDITSLVNEGLVAADSTLFRGQRAERELNEGKTPKPVLDPESNHTKYEQAAIDIVSRFRSHIFDYAVRAYPEDLLGFIDNGRTYVRYMGDYIQSRYISRSKLRTYIDESLEVIREKKPFSVSDFSSVQAYNLCDHFVSILYNFQDCLYLSTVKNSPFVSAFNDVTIQRYPYAPELIDDLYYLVRTNLTDELLVLPAPRTLREAIRLRNDKRLIRFREVLAGWLDALQKGDIFTLQTIKRDLRKANYSLTALDTWRRYERSPINFWLNSIGGHIPLLSNVLAVMYMLGGMCSHQVAQRDSWLMLVQGNSRSCSTSRIE